MKESCFHGQGESRPQSSCEGEDFTRTEKLFLPFGTAIISEIRRKQKLSDKTKAIHPSLGCLLSPIESNSQIPPFCFLLLF